MSWNVYHCADQSCVVTCMHVDIGGGERNVTESLLHVLVPLSHELVEVWHLFCVVYSGGWSSLVQILHAVDPS